MYSMITRHCETFMIFLYAVIEVSRYFSNVNNFSKLIYFSVVKETRVPLSSMFKFNSNYLRSSSRDDYQIPKNWKKP